MLIRIDCHFQEILTLRVVVRKIFSKHPPNCSRLLRKKGPVLLSTSRAQQGRTFSQLRHLSFAQKSESTFPSAPGLCTTQNCTAAARLCSVKLSRSRPKGATDSCAPPPTPVPSFLHSSSTAAYLIKTGYSSTRNTTKVKPIEMFLTDSKHYISQSSETRLHVHSYKLDVIVLKELVAKDQKLTLLST